jgi:NAD(P)-dependent dehydrogenase (short-subunit alcohol dehydrogenase family)
MKQLEGRIAVVTGASTGIGRSIARSFAGAGMRVVLASQNEHRLDAAVAELRATGAEVLGVPTDVADEAAVQRLADATLDAFGAVHVLVNNAGVYAPGYAWEISRAEWEWVMGVNLWGPIHAVRAFLPHLLAQEEGHVVNVSSAGGLMPATVHGPYCTTKHGLVGLSKALKADLALKGAAVGVTLVCPGAVATEITTQIQHTGPGGVARGSVELAPEVQGAWDSILAYTDAGIDSDDVGEMVLEAVREDRFWLLPNGEVFHGVFERELDDLKAGR